MRRRTKIRKPARRLKRLMPTLKVSQAYRKIKGAPKTTTAALVGIASAALLLYKFLK